MLKSVKSRSLKSAGRHDGRNDIVSEQFSEKDLDIHDNRNDLCRWSFRLFQDSSIIHMYKFTSSHFQRKISDIPSPLSGPVISAIQAEQGSINGKINQQEVLSDDSATETSIQDLSRFQREQSPTSIGHSLASPPLNTSISSVGWPLLHKPFLAKGASFNGTSSHKMSVIEWALQLPDRPKEILNHCTNLKGHQVESSKQFKVNQDDIELEIAKSCNLEMSNILLCNGNGVKCKIKDFCQGKLCKEYQFLELLIATSNFSSKKIIGKGSGSQVYRGLFSDGEMVAVKRLNKSSLNSEEEFLTELEIISNLDHCCIAKFLGYCIEAEYYFLVYKLASEGNLEEKLHGTMEKSVLSWDVRFNVAIGIAKALKYLHDGCTRPVIHRDVKSSNILLSSDLQPQLADFGLAKWVPDVSAQITCIDIVGTFGYLAPEYVMFGKVSKKTDVYSFGVVLLELITGRRPINDSNPKGEESLVAWAREILKDKLNSHQLIDPKLGGQYNAIQVERMIIAASHCIRQSPQSRPHMHQILRLLIGETEGLENSRQQSICDDGYDMLPCRKNMQSHLTLAMVGLDDADSLCCSDHGFRFHIPRSSCGGTSTMDAITASIERVEKL